MHGPRRALGTALVLVAGGAIAADPPFQDPLVSSRAALAWLDHPQDETDELQAGGRGALEIAA